MYTVYIKNYKRSDGTIATTETQMFSVPSSSGFPVQRPTVKCSEDSAENFSFSMESNSPYYDALLQLKTLIRVVYDGTTIFNGRVLSISTSTVFHTKSVTCEGWYAFLNDTYYEGIQEKFRKKIPLINLTEQPNNPDSYLGKIILNHKTNAPDKAITLGTIQTDKLNLPTNEDKYEQTSWSQTSSLLSGLTSNYGGHIRIRYVGDTKYFDWYKYYTNDAGDGSRPSVTVGKNILDLSSEDQVDIIFTRVIPIGATNHDGKPTYIDGYRYTDKNGAQHDYSGKSVPVYFIRDLYSDQQLNDEFHNANDYTNAEANYGIIYKTVQFGDADTQEKLWNETKKWIKNCYFGLATSFTVKAVDFHIQDSTFPKILLGECVDVKYKIVRNGTAVWETKKLVCKSVQYDLFNPENNSYTFGIPTDMLENNKNNSSNKRAASEQTPPKKTSPKQSDGMSLTWRGVWQMIGSRNNDPDYEGTTAALSFYENPELDGTLNFYDPYEIIDGLNTKMSDPPGPLTRKDHWFTGRLVGKFRVSPTSIMRYVAVSGDRGVFAFSSHTFLNPVEHWYSQRSGYRYHAGDTKSAISSFEHIAQMIAKDTDSDYGGTTRAESFRSFGKMSGTARLYDQSQIPQGQSTPPAEAFFTADIVGKFDIANIDNDVTYIAISKEYGVLGYRFGAGYTTINSSQPVAHWYQRAKGMTYDNITGFMATENPPATFGTDDGTPGGKPTVIVKPQEQTYPPFSTSNTYKIGDIIKVGTKLYKCIRNINTPGQYHAEDWEEYTTAPSQNPEGQVLVGGTVSVGENTSGTGNGWRIKLNDTIKYPDSDGNLQTAVGFVRAEDFNLNSIPSFKTKFAVVDHLIAGKVDASEISADLAYLRKINSNTISTNTIISVQKSFFTKIMVGGTEEGAHEGIFSNWIYYKKTGMPMINIMGHIYQAYRMTNTNGTVKLQGVKMNAEAGEWSDIASFNMAATQFFMDSVAAAWNNGGATSYFTASRTGTLEPGQDATMQAYYTNYDGQATRSTISGTTRHSELTIAARALRLRTPVSAIRPTTSNQTITPGNDSGGLPYDGLAQVVVEGDSDLIAENIKKNVTIFGVTGTHEGGGAISWITGKCYPSEATSPEASDDQGHMHSCERINSNSYTITSEHKSIRVIFKVGEQQYYYYFAINR